MIALINTTKLYSPFYHKHGPYHAEIHEFSSNVCGSVLDIGCGSKPYRDLIDVEDDAYIGLDFDEEADNDVLGDALHLPFKNSQFDYVLANQILEHLPNPFAFFKELSRVLCLGGKALVTTNQAYFLHGLPHDYFRFTRYGLSVLADSADLENEHLIEIGTTLQHLCSKIGLGFKIKIPYPVNLGAVAVINLLFWPIQDIEPFEDYSITGIVVKKPAS